MMELGAEQIQCAWVSSGELAYIFAACVHAHSARMIPKPLFFLSNCV